MSTAGSQIINSIGKRHMPGMLPISSLALWYLDHRISSHPSLLWCQIFYRGVPPPFFSPSLTVISSTPRSDCRICKKKVLSHAKSLFCTLCLQTSHLTCLNLYSDTNVLYATNANNNWSYPSCLKENFPFFYIENQKELTSILTQTINIDQQNLDTLVFDPFDLNDDTGVHDNIDPDSNFFATNHRNQSSCQYLHVDALNSLDMCMREEYRH